MNKIRVLIADDHAMFRQGITQLISMEKDIEVVGHASNGDDAVEQCRKIRPDVVLMDINMPQRSGLSALEALNSDASRPRVVMLTLHEEREYLVKALQLGAEGYVLKDAESTVLLDAIRRVMSGETVIPAHLARDIVLDKNKKAVPDDNVWGLTEREIEVLRLIADGQLNRDIAKMLYISEKTVKNHISSIFRKLNVTDRTQAAIMVLKNKL